MNTVRVSDLTLAKTVSSTGEKKKEKYSKKKVHLNSFPFISNCEVNAREVHVKSNFHIHHAEV